MAVLKANQPLLKKALMNQTLDLGNCLENSTERLKKINMETIKLNLRSMENRKQKSSIHTSSRNMEQKKMGVWY